MSQPPEPSLRKLIWPIFFLSLCTAVLLICFWAGLQVIAPRIADATQVIESAPEILVLLIFGVALTYILKHF